MATHRLTWRIEEEKMGCAWGTYMFSFWGLYFSLYPHLAHSQRGTYMLVPQHRNLSGKRNTPPILGFFFFFFFFFFYKTHTFLGFLEKTSRDNAKNYILSRENGNTHVAPYTFEWGGGVFYTIRWIYKYSYNKLFGSLDNDNLVDETLLKHSSLTRTKFILHVGTLNQACCKVTSRQWMQGVQTIEWLPTFLDCLWLCDAPAWKS